MELLYKCDCGTSRVITDAQADQLEACPICRKIDRLPGLNDFIHKLKELRQSHEAFSDPDPDTKTRPTPSDDAFQLCDQAKIRLTKMRLCLLCYGPLDLEETQEIEGLCPHCIDRVAGHYKRQAFHESRTLRYTVDDLKNKVSDNRFHSIVSLLYGVVTGFALGGICVFLVRFFKL